MSSIPRYPYYQPLTFDQPVHPVQPQAQPQPQNVTLGQEKPVEPLFPTTDITLRLESRPCIFQVKDEDGNIRDVLRYVLVWVNDDETFLFGAVDNPIGKVTLDLKYSTQLHPLPKATAPAPAKAPAKAPASAQMPEPVEG